MRPARRFQPRSCRGEEGHERNPVETLLEPISQPALEQEIVIGLIKAERTMWSYHWNKRAWHIPKSNLPVACGFAYHEIDRLIARLVCIIHADQRPHFKVGAKKHSREDDRKEGRRASWLRARRWASGCCCGMRSRGTEPSIDAGSDPSQELTPPVDDADYCCSGEAPP